MELSSIPVLMNNYRQPEITNMTNNTLHNIPLCYKVLCSDWTAVKLHITMLHRIHHCFYSNDSYSGRSTNYFMWGIKGYIIYTAQIHFLKHNNLQGFIPYKIKKRTIFILVFSRKCSFRSSQINWLEGRKWSGYIADTKDAVTEQTVLWWSVYEAWETAGKQIGWRQWSNPLDLTTKGIVWQTSPEGGSKMLPTSSYPPKPIISVLRKSKSVSNGMLSGGLFPRHRKHGILCT